MTTPDKNLDYRQTASVTDVHASVKREKDDPQTGLEPATISVFAICAVFLMIGGAYLGANGGFNGASVLPGYTPEPPKTEGAAVEDDPRAAWLKAGKKKFTNCASCHALNGLGKPGVYPPLKGSEWVTGGTERLAALILYGLVGPITVSGQSYSGQEKMPAHKDSFSSEQIAQVMSYIRNNWGNEGSFVTTEMVESVKQKYADRSSEFKNAELPAPDADIPGDLPEWAGGAPAAEADTPAEGADAAEGDAEPAGEEPAPTEN